MAAKWEMRIQRLREETGANKKRVVGTYQILHDGKAVAGLSGMTLETKGPGDNSHEGNNRCVEAGTYTLMTQDGPKYCTIDYSSSESYSTKGRKPALHLFPTGKRVGVLFHPGIGFLSSVGCINPTKTLGGPKQGMDYAESRKRVIAVIEDIKTILQTDFPTANGKKIPGAVITIMDIA
jgi:hypothetical protein